MVDPPDVGPFSFWTVFCLAFKIEVEKQMILQTLDEAGGNRTHAAEILGISRRTLQLKLKKYDIQ